MIDKVFLDTNILIYSLDNHEQEKKRKARKLLSQIQNSGSTVISTQVLQEFHVVCVKKLGIDPMLSKSIIHSFAHFETILIDVDLIKEAIDCQVTYKLSFWDALIIVSAERAECPVLWTEDMHSGSVIRNVQIVNPFKENNRA